MEVISFSVLSFILVNVLGIVSFMWYKHYRASLSSQDPPKQADSKSDNKKEKQKKIDAKQKAKQKNNQLKQKKKTPATENLSDTESFTTEEQLAQTIISQHHFSQDSINTTAVNAKPTIKKPAPTQRSNSKTRKGSTNEIITERDPDWENVIGRKHKKKLYPTTKHGEKFEFTLDDEGGIVELPFCEMHFPAESVLKPLHIAVEEENYRKFVDDTEEKVFVTPALHFTKDRDTKLRRQFTMKLNTLKMMGRGWNGNVCCQIEMKDSDYTWITTGRTEYVFGKPVQFAGDDLTSFRAVITRSQNGLINRELRISAYIARPKVQNPSHHFVHLCICDKSQQSQYKVESNMQQFLMKMEPRICNVQFGRDLQFKIEPSKKFTPEDKDVFMRWTEICKAFVNVRFQIRLNRNVSGDPSFEAEYRTMVFLNIFKVCATATTTQEEYFHFYWVAAPSYPKKGKGRRVKGQEDKVSEDDGFASGSDALTTPDTDNPPDLAKSGARITSSKPPLPPKSGASSKTKGNKKKGPKPSRITPNGPQKSTTPLQPLSLPKQHPTKSGLPPLKTSNVVPSSKKKSRSSKKKLASLKNDNYTLNILNDLEKVKAQVQSIFPPTVLPGMGIPQTRPQKSSISDKPVTKQSTTVKSQEFTASQKPSKIGANPTVNKQPQGPPNTPTSANPQKTPSGGRSPKKGKSSRQQSGSKVPISNDHRSHMTSKDAEKGSGDKAKTNGPRQERPKVSPSPFGAKSHGTSESTNAEIGKVTQEGHKPHPIRNAAYENSKPNAAPNRLKQRPQKSRQSQERNQRGSAKPNDQNSHSNHPNNTHSSPSRPKIPRPQQNGPLQKSRSPDKKTTVLKTSGVAKLMNGPTSNITAERNGVADEVPKDRRPRRPRNRQRGPPDSQPQPRPIKSEAS